MGRVIGISIFLAVLAVSLLGLDLWLQLAEIQPPLENRADAELGPVYRDNVRFSRFSEGFFLGGANEWGYLGKGAPPARTPGVVRIALMGDSFVLGHTVFERHHFKETLARELSARVGRPVEVLNFARADYCLWNMHQHYVDHVLKWDPDLTLFFLSDGDLTPNYPADPAMYPYTELVDGELRTNRGFLHSGKRRLYLRVEPVLTRLALPRLGFNLLKVIDSGQWRSMLLGKFAPAQEDGPGVKLGEVPGPLPAEALALPGPPLPEVSTRILRDLAARGRTAAVIQWEIRPTNREAIIASGLPTMELAPLWAEMLAGGVDPWYWAVTGKRGHWNHVAHGELGEYLADRISNSVGTPRPSERP